MAVPFFDLTRQFETLRPAIEAAVDDVLTSQRCIGGPHVAALEEALAEQVGVAHAVGVSSGTDALLASLMALGIGPGDEVITTPFTFIAPIEAILRVGARPVFVDIDPVTFNLDVAGLQAAITDKTRAILPVHLFGQACDMTALMEVARAEDLLVIEDMAQALGATCGGRQVGSFGQVGCVSFFPTKNLGAAGDGGMIFCDDDQLVRAIRRICRHGAQPKYHHIEVGGNFRLDAIQAAILNVKRDYLETWNEARRRHAAAYDEALASIDGLRLPREAQNRRSVYNQYTIAVDDRDGLRDYLSAQGIGTNIYYPEALHTQPVVAKLGYEAGDYPRAEKACEQVLALPVFPELRRAERDKVCAAIAAYFL